MKHQIGSEIQDFFEAELGLTAKVDDVYFIGLSEPRTCVVTLATLQEKKEIMSRKSLLKDTLNIDEKPIFINDYWNAEKTEARKVERELIDTNKKLPEGKQKVINEGAQLLLDGLPWKKQKKVNTPTPSDLIDLSVSELSDVINTEVMKGDEVTAQGNRFIGYSITPSSYTQIQQAYMKIKLIHPDADHVMSAYYMNECDLFSQDYCDDGEHGGGRALLDYLLENRLKQRSVFVVRYFSGKKLSADRFRCIKQAAISAVRQCAKNKPPGITQEALLDNPIDLQNQAQQTSPQSKQRRVRSLQSRLGSNWRRGNHTTAVHRGNQPRGARGGRGTRGTRGTRSYSAAVRGARPPVNPRHQHTPRYHQQSQRRSRYEEFFQQDNNSVNSNRSYRAPQEDWSYENQGAFTQSQ